MTGARVHGPVQRESARWAPLGARVPVWPRAGGMVQQSANDSRREKPFHQELPALFVASPKHNPKLPILSISYLSRFPPRVPFSASHCLTARDSPVGLQLHRNHATESRFGIAGTGPSRPRPLTDNNKRHSFEEAKREMPVSPINGQDYDLDPLADLECFEWAVTRHFRKVQ